MKKIISLILANAILFSVIAQNKYVNSKHVKIPNTVSSIVTKPQDMNEKLTALEFSKMLGNGINLGNTMEAYRGSGMGTNADATSYEKLWGQPITTKKMIEGYKSAGFDTLRIPVAWTNVIDYTNGDYTIKKTYLDRIETLVNYALDAGMYVIINDHWDGGWWGLFGQKDAAKREDAMELYKSMWTQIGERFKNYSYKLIFEGGNEEIGDRLNDDNGGFWGRGALSEDGRYITANKINQTFVDLIRSQGGNNAKRFLLIPGYNTDIKKTCDERFKMPTDSVKNRLFLSVHYYDPSDFCIGSGDLWGSKSDYEYQNETLKMLTKFTEKGYGIIIGEYGALPQNGTYKTSTLAWTTNFLDNCDLYNYVPVLWDTGSGCFYDKSSAKLIHKELQNLYDSRRYEKENKDYKKVQSAAENNLQKVLSSAKTSLSGNKLEGRKDVAVAYLMYTDKNWGTNYSVGDDYKPNSKAKGLEAVDAEIKGKGEYSVKIDFSGTKSQVGKGFAFSAVGIANGESLYPDWVIEIKEIKVNGKPVNMTAKGYTCSDNGKTTRVNIINEWVPEVPKTGVRTKSGSTEGCSATIIDKKASVFQNMKTLEVVFWYGPQD